MVSRLSNNSSLESDRTEENLTEISIENFSGAKAYATLNNKQSENK